MNLFWQEKRESEYLTRLVRKEKEKQIFLRVKWENMMLVLG